MRRVSTWLLIAVALLACQRQDRSDDAPIGFGPPPDSLMGQAVAKQLFDELLHDLPRNAALVVGDSTDWRALRAAADQRDRMLSVRMSTPDCPSRNSSSSPQGYFVRLKTWRMRSGRILLGVSVFCGNGALAVGHGVTWELHPHGLGWRLGRVEDRWMT